MQLDQPLEWLFTNEVLSKITSFYSITNNHCEFDRSSNTNEYPFERFDLKDALWKRDLPEDHRLDEIIGETLWRDFHEFSRPDIKEHEGFDVFFDINGYRIMPKIPIKDLEERKEELENEFDNAEDDEERQEIQEEYNEVLEELGECANKLEAFDEWFKSFKEGHKQWVDGFIITIDEYDDYGVCTDMDSYLDRKDEEQLRRWTPEGIIDEREAGLKPDQTKIISFVED